MWTTRRSNGMKDANGTNFANGANGTNFANSVRVGKPALEHLRGGER